MIDEAGIRSRYLAIEGRLDERGRRLFVAVENAAAGHDGTAAVFRAKDRGAASAAPVQVRRVRSGRG